MVKQLIENGADPNTLDTSNNTALIVATKRGILE